MKEGLGKVTEIKCTVECMYLPCHLYFVSIHTDIKAFVYSENIQVTCKVLLEWCTKLVSKAFSYRQKLQVEQRSVQDCSLHELWLLLQVILLWCPEILNEKTHNLSYLHVAINSFIIIANIFLDYDVH